MRRLATGRSLGPQEATGLEMNEFALTFELENPRRIISDICVGSVIRSGDTLQVEMGIRRTYRALWDTGSPFTYVEPKIVRECGLQRSGFHPSTGLHGDTPVICTVHTATIGIVKKAGNRTSDMMISNPLGVVCLEKDGQLKGEVDILIGMDFIGLGDMALSTDSSGRRWMSYLFPSRGRRLNLKTAWGAGDKPTTRRGRRK